MSLRWNFQGQGLPPSQLPLLIPNCSQFQFNCIMIGHKSRSHAGSGIEMKFWVKNHFNHRRLNTTLMKQIFCQTKRERECLISMLPLYSHYYVQHVFSKSIQDFKLSGLSCLKSDTGGACRQVFQGGWLSICTWGLLLDIRHALKTANEHRFLDNTHYPLRGHLSIKQGTHDGSRSLDAWDMKSDTSDLLSVS